MQVFTMNDQLSKREQPLDSSSSFQAKLIQNSNSEGDSLMNAHMNNSYMAKNKQPKLHFQQYEQPLPRKVKQKVHSLFHDQAEGEIQQNVITNKSLISNLKHCCSSKKNKSYKNSFKLQIKPKCLLLPHSIPKITWDIFCMLIIFYEMILIPFRISFPREDYLIFEQIDTCCDFIFLLDIFLTFNTAAYQKGMIVFDRRKIAAQYIQLWFWLDLFSTLPYSLIVENAMESEDNQAQILRMMKIFKFIKVIRLLRIMKLKAMVNKLIVYFDISHGIQFMLGFLRLVLIILFLAHLIACIWHLVGELDEQQNWMMAIDIYESDSEEQYIASLYWAVTTMLAIGYGDIIPKNQTERIVAMVTMLVTCVQFGYSVNTMGQMFRNFDQRNQEAKNQIDRIGNYLKLKKIPFELQMKIKKYLEYIWEEKNKINTLEGFITNKLSAGLRNDFIFEMNMKVIYKSKLLKNKFSEQLIYNACILMKERIVTPEEMVFEQFTSEYEENSLYFLSKGSVEIHLVNKLIGQVNENLFFGDVGFISDMRFASAKASSFCVLLMMERSSFLEIIRQRFRKDLEVFLQIKDNIRLYGSFSDLDISCFLCKKKGHIGNFCPQVSFLNDRRLFILEIYEQHKLFCKSFARKTLKRFSQKEIVSSHCEFLEQEVEIIETLEQSLQRERASHKTSEIDFNTSQAGKKKQLKLQQFVKHMSFRGLAENLMQVSNKKEIPKVKEKFIEQTKNYYNTYNYFADVGRFEKMREYKYYFPNNNLSSVSFQIKKKFCDPVTE